MVELELRKMSAPMCVVVLKSDCAFVPCLFCFGLVCFSFLLPSQLRFTTVSEFDEFGLLEFD